MPPCLTASQAVQRKSHPLLPVLHRLCITGGSNASATKHQGKTSGGKAAATPRTDWSQGDNLVFLSRAVERWLEKTGPVITRDPKISLKHYCAFLDIPYNTFRHYVATDLTKRRKLGNPSGKQKLLDSDVEKFTIDMLRAKDRCNEGLNKRQASQPLEASACTLALATDCTLPRRHPQLSTTRLELCYLRVGQTPPLLLTQ